MPAVSEKQRAFIYATKGKAFAKRHHFDNKGKLPKRSKRSSRNGKASDRDQLMEAFRRRSRKRRHRG